MILIVRKFIHRLEILLEDAQLFGGEVFLGYCRSKDTFHKEVRKI